MMNWKNWVKAGVVAMAFLMGFAISSHTKAKADPTSDALVASEAGPVVCQALDQQGATEAVVMKIGHAAVDSFGITPRQAGMFIGQSVAVYCPEYTDEIVQIAQSYDKQDGRTRLVYAR